MFPLVEPFASGLLPVGDGNEIYWETSGNPGGTPVVHLHGGPGSGIQGGYRGRQDPADHLIVGFDQRGCGRSLPSVGELAGSPALEHSLATNTTQASIDDMERLRAHLGVDAWIVAGISWGTTLALSYAQAHPERVLALVLAAVTTTSTPEVAWLTEDMRRIFPEEWDVFAGAVPREEGERTVDAYARALRSPDAGLRASAARAWCTWEDVHVSLATDGAPNPRYADPAFRQTFATLVTHYWSHAGFGGDRILERMDRLAGIPGRLIHGRLDISSPLETAWRLHRAWPASELVVVESEGHGGPTMIEHLSDALATLSKAIRRR